VARQVVEKSSRVRGFAYADMIVAQDLSSRGGELCVLSCFLRIRAEVATVGYGPLVALFEEAAPTSRNTPAGFGKTSTTLDRRLISF
jgi:hypothetical protein